MQMGASTLGDFSSSDGEKESHVGHYELFTFQMKNGYVL